MPSRFSGRIQKVRRVNNGVSHQKNHRWESFSVKLAKFNSLHPLRKVRRHDLDAEDLSATVSYFQHGLQKWAELNISKTFSSFKEVQSLCESLPQILHHEEKIMQLLVEFISLHDKDALEPLLDLLTAFAHDLGSRFEKFYLQSLKLLLAIVEKPQNVEVIEWTFAAVAFLFKYLSKILVLDLRPTFETLKPLLGKNRPPQHIARFAAEAMSFLVRKSAVTPSIRGTTLASFVECVKIDLLATLDSQNFLLYKDGLMTMFAEAIKGNNATIHSTGSTIMTALIDCLTVDQHSRGSQPVWLDFICGTLTNVLHHATSETFATLEDDILESLRFTRERSNLKSIPWQNASLIKILGVLAGVRRGSRIRHWDRVLEELTKSLASAQKEAEGGTFEGFTFVNSWALVITQVAILWHHAPTDALIPALVPMTQIFSSKPFMTSFIPFCSFMSDLNPERFASFFRKPFQKFVSMHWSEHQNEDILYTLLPRMIESQAFPKPPNEEAFKLPLAWQNEIVSRFERLETSPFPGQDSLGETHQQLGAKDLPRYARMLQLLKITNFHSATRARIAELLLRKLKLALRPTTSLKSAEIHFIVGTGLQAYLEFSKALGNLDLTLTPLLRTAIPRFAQSVQYLQSYRVYAKDSLQHLTNSLEQGDGIVNASPSDMKSVLGPLMENLSSPSRALRLVSLEIIRDIDDSQSQNELADLMLQIERMSLTPDNTRTCTMLLRRLGLQYASADQSSWLVHGIPKFLFGMLTIKLLPVRDAAVQTLSEISQYKIAQEAIGTLAFAWIEAPRRALPPTATNESSLPRTDFECTVYQGIEKLADLNLELSQHPAQTSLQYFQEQVIIHDQLAIDARFRALLVLNALPSLAEKRSRHLVPYLLNWAFEDDSEETTNHMKSLSSEHGWTFADRKSLLSVISQFRNPRASLQPEKVYDALLRLLENGDPEIQKLALKSIFGWKKDGVRAYQENLEFLLDDARFRNELALLLQGNSVVKQEYRPDLLPVLLRLLYGRAISKKGHASNRNGPETNRIAVLRNLSVEDMGLFIGIAVGKLGEVSVRIPRTQRRETFDTPGISTRKQLGFLHMAMSILSELGSRVDTHVETLLQPILYCLIFACRKLFSVSIEAEHDPPLDNESRTISSQLRAMRSLGLKCLVMLFRNASTFDWTPYKDIIMEEVVIPRLEKLPMESTEGVSGLLSLLYTWSASPGTALYLGPHGAELPGGVLPHLLSCLSGQKTKDSVKIFVLTILQNLVAHTSTTNLESDARQKIRNGLLHPAAEELVLNISTILHSLHTGVQLVEICIETILLFAPILQAIRFPETLITVSCFLLKQPARRVSPKIKGKTLLVLEECIASPHASGDSAVWMEIYETVSALFSYFKDRENRLSLSRTFVCLSNKIPDYSEITIICEDLNSFKANRIDARDYDRRLAAFNRLSMSRDCNWTPNQWLPILHNLFYFLKMDEEFGLLSTNSADGLRSFIKSVSHCESSVLKPQFEDQMSNFLMPALYAGARESSQTVRRECLRVFGYMLTVLPDWPPVAQLKGLLSDRQEESAEPVFFFNILSPATSRKLEALRILQAANLAHEMDSHNIAQFFIPMLEHFIFGRDDARDDGGLGAEATITIGHLAGSLQWNQWRAIFHRYVNMVASRPEIQKQIVRLLGKFVDALAVELDQNDESKVAHEQYESSASCPRRLRTAGPSASQLATTVSDVLLPPLLKHLHEKDESEVSYRVPIGVVIVKLLKLLPADQTDQKLAAVLTDICHILRSKAWEAREMARDTLVKIAAILGLSYFGFILKELRGALTRGYQLHVLSYTMHSILVSSVPTFGPGDLDHCLPAIGTVIMDDIFGVVGQEKDAQDYSSQMKEVKGSKSQDSMELVSKIASINQLVHLIRPIQGLLLQNVDLKTTHKIDALLNRIVSGLVHNASAGSQDVLVFCYEVIQEAYHSQDPSAEVKMDPKLRRYIVQKGARRSGERGKSTKQSFKIIRFAFDVLRSVFKKYDSQRSSANVAGFLPILGDALLDSEDEVKVSAFRLLSLIAKVPLTALDEQGIFKLATQEAIKTLNSTTSTTEIAQAALKMLAVVLRDRRDVPVKPAAIDMLLTRLKEDFTEPLYRHVTFNFLRSILGREIETAVLYDTLDHIGSVMISNDDKDTRDLARGAFFQFVRTYPQTRARWGKQLDFVIANLRYESEGGRLSVMEVIHLLLLKSLDEFVQEVAGNCFLPLFLVLANDDSEKCRLLAGELLKQIFRCADAERTQRFLLLLRGWLGKDDNPAVLGLALQLFRFYFESNPRAQNNTQDCRLVLARIMDIHEPSNAQDIDAQLLQASLDTVHLFTTEMRKEVLAAGKEKLWRMVTGCLQHSDTAVRLATVRTLGSYLADFENARGRSARGEVLVGTLGLKFNVEDASNLSCLAFRALSEEGLDEAVANELASILVFVGSYLPITANPVDGQDLEYPGEVDDDSGTESLETFLSKLSQVLRKEVPPQASALSSKVSAMGILEQVYRRTPMTQTKDLLRTILLPLHHLTDASIPVPHSNEESFTAKLEGIKMRAQVLMDLLQKKFGAMQYGMVLLKIAEEVKARRQQRTSKRKIEAIAQPEKYGRDKRKKFVKEKERRKARSKEHRAMRQSFKGW